MKKVTGKERNQHRRNNKSGKKYSDATTLTEVTASIQKETKNKRMN